MKYKLTGEIKRREGTGWANKRFESCKEILKRHTIAFPPFDKGTLNIKLVKDFPTPNWPNIIHISEDELKEADPNFTRESWHFIPVLEINKKEIKGYIYRTSTNYHGNGWVELVTRDLNGVINIDEGVEVELILWDGENE